MSRLLSKKDYQVTVQGGAKNAGNRAGIWRLGDGNKSKNPLIPQSRQKTPHFGTPTERLHYQFEQLSPDTIGEERHGQIQI